MKLVSLALAVDGHPTLDQVDAMLVELQSVPRDENVMKLVDDLLDYRSALRTRAA
jgi:hypothetical protein